MDFQIQVKARDVDGKITTLRRKTIYAANGRSASGWARSTCQERLDRPQLSSAVTVVGRASNDSRIGAAALGCFVANSNIVQYNQVKVLLLSSSYSSTWGYSIDEENFRRVAALFCARKAIKPNWLNDKDEYLVPDTEHPDYEQWNNDAIVYALFNSASQQSALRGIAYKGKTWDIQNQFFWMSRELMQREANHHGFNAMYQDAKRLPEDMFVWKIRERSPCFSVDAENLLGEAGELVMASLEFRAAWHKVHPEHHLNAWNAGWAQLKPVLKRHLPEQYKAFTEGYRKFEARMRAGVYKFGFLKE